MVVNATEVEDDELETLWELLDRLLLLRELLRELDEDDREDDDPILLLLLETLRLEDEIDSGLTIKSSIHHGILDDELDRLELETERLLLRLELDRLLDRLLELLRLELDRLEEDREEDESAEAIVTVHRQVPTAAPSVLFQSLNSYSSLR